MDLHLVIPSAQDGFAGLSLFKKCQIEAIS